MPRETKLTTRRRSSSSRARAGDGNGLRIHLLDVGTQQYGDCILCELDSRYILIDGGHPSDFRGTTGHRSIPAQLETIFGHPAPFPIDLLVATHCHLDHIGCLPDLVAHDLKVKWALVADEKLGFPSAQDMGGDSEENPAYRLVAALTEENYADSVDDAGINQLLQDAARLDVRYSEMLDQLDKEGTLIRYRGLGLDTPDLKKLEKAFVDFGLEILGPTKNQLEICRDYLKSAAQDIAGQLAPMADDLNPETEANLYRRLANQQSAADQQDRQGPGAAKNDQSIVLKFAVGKHTLLFTGDMQFADAQVPKLDDDMSALLKHVDEMGPYTFVKLAHHGSDNGLDADVLKGWEKTVSFGCSSGTKDKTHPNAKVLKLLKQDSDNIEWARTDKNGMITIEFDGDKPTMEVSRGKLNDSSPAAGADDSTAFRLRMSSYLALRELYPTGCPSLRQRWRWVVQSFLCG